MNTRQAWAILLLFVVLFAGLAVVIYVDITNKDRDLLTVAFLDVGQGDAIYVETPAGTQMLIDGGPDRSVLTELSKVMPWWDRSLDIVVATHPDKDHIGGLISVLENYQVDYYLESGQQADTGVFDELAFVLEQEEGLQQILARQGMSLDLGAGVSYQVLFPSQVRDGLDRNIFSVVGQLDYGDVEVLLAGDIPLGVEQQLVQRYGDSLESEVLKLGHHGSDTSSSLELLQVVSPAMAIVSAGLGNRYGHPHDEVLDRVEKVNAKVLETAKQGTIIFHSDGETIWQAN